MERDTGRAPDPPETEPQRWHWRHSQIEPDWCYPTSPPANPAQGAVWHDVVEQLVYVWSGTEWIELRED